jgi:hypothetical protein
MDPYRHDAMSIEDFRSLAAVAAASWNLATVPKNDRAEMMAEALSDESLSNSATLIALVHDLVRRKEALFPDDRRLIVSWDVSPRPGGFFLSAAAATTRDPAPDSAMGGRGSVAPTEHDGVCRPRRSARARSGRRVRP